MNDPIVDVIANQSLDILMSVASQALATKATLIEPPSVHKIGRSVGTGTRGIYRVSGSVETSDGEKSWSAIVKVIDIANVPNRETHLDHPERELAVYRTVAFAETDGGMCTPRCFELYEEDGLHFLWQEDLSSAAPWPWMTEHFLVAARHIGRFNGTRLELTNPVETWLSRGGLRLKYRNAGMTAAFANLPNIEDHPFVRQVAPTGIERLMQHWQDGAELFAHLAAFPKGLCHLDCHQKNLFLFTDPEATTKLVAIDWACVGFECVGFDIGYALASAVKWLELTPGEAHRLAEPLLNSYLQGLVESGWDGDENQVRLTYWTVIAMEANRIVGLVTAATKNADFRNRMNSFLGLSPEEVFDRWQQALDIFLDYKEHALRLARSM